MYELTKSVVCSLMTSVTTAKRAAAAVPSASGVAVAARRVERALSERSDCAVVARAAMDDDGHRTVQQRWHRRRGRRTTLHSRPSSAAGTWLGLAVVWPWRPAVAAVSATQCQTVASRLGQHLARTTFS